MRSLKVLLLFDLSVKISPEDYEEYWKTPDWKTEKDVRNTLVKLGHEVVPFGLYNDIEPFLRHHHPAGNQAGAAGLLDLMLFN